MKTLPMKLLVGACALTLCSGPVAFGQEQPAAQPQQEQQTEQKLTGKLVKGSEVVGANIFNQQGEDLGEIEDVMFDENTGGVTHAILAIGGFLGIGERLVAVPWKHIHQSKQPTEGYVLELDKGKLSSAPQFQKREWGELDDNWFEKNDAFFGLQHPKGKKLVRMSQVNGAQLFNQQGEQIGEISDALMHPNSGKVAYGILSIGEYVGVGRDKLTAVPWKLIRQSEKSTPGFVVNADKAKLQGSTYFDRNAWPDYSDPAWNERAYGYWRVQPYWYPVVES